MATVTAGVAMPEALEVLITVRATFRELKEYTEFNTPSHAVAHRLTEAIHRVAMKLQATVSEPVERS